MRGLAILLGFHLLGMALVSWLDIPLPPNVAGLILFLLSLWLRIIRLEWVESTAQFLLRHMMLFFIPYIVGTIAFWPMIEKYGLAIVVSLATSSLVALAITGWVTTVMERGKGGSRHRPDQSV